MATVKPFHKRVVDVEMVVVVLFAVPIIASFSFIFNYLAMEDELSLILHPLTLFESIFHRADVARFTSQGDFTAYVNQSRALYGPTHSQKISPWESISKNSSTRRVGGATTAHQPDQPQIMSGNNGLLTLGRTTEHGSVILSALPPAGARVASRVPESGLLLQNSDTLVILSRQFVTAYDISRPEFPSRRWQINLANGVELQSAELENTTAYLLLAQSADTFTTCPVMVAQGRAGTVAVDCRSIAHPTGKILPADILYTFLAIENKSGVSQRTFSFLAPSSGTVARLFPDSAYLAYAKTSTDALKRFYSDFFTSHTRDLLPYTFIRSLQNSERAEGPMVVSSRITEALGQLERTMTPAARLHLEQELQSRFKDYVREKSRNVQQTHLTKIRLGNFFIEAGGSADGTLTGPEMMDASNGNLRLVTTVDSARIFPWLSNDTRVAEFDLFLLNGNLRTINARRNFAQETLRNIELSRAGAYLSGDSNAPVTVLNLSSGRKIGLESKLPLFGLNWRIEPLPDSKAFVSITGQGKQTTVAFGDSIHGSASAPINSTILNEPWSTVNSHYDAALLDPLQKFFFLPGAHRGYVFEVSSTGLRLLRTVEQPVRASLSLNGFLYLLGNSDVIILDEQSWEIINEIKI